MPDGGFPTIRRLLKASIDDAIGRGATVIDTDAEIARLAEHYPNGLPFGETELRSEILDIAKQRGLAVKMGGGEPYKH